MKFNFEETIIRYNPVLLEEWKQGKRSFLPEGYQVLPEVINQPSYHFGEHFVWSHYLKGGWKGFVWYGIGEWEPDNKKYDEGRGKVIELFSGRGLEEIRVLRKGLESGEPDLFFYKDDGSAMFVEVKKGSDKLSETQLTCFAQIKSILGVDIKVVYVLPEGTEYKPKTIELDLDLHGGRVLSD